MLWYRPNGGDVYRVIDADMTVRQVEPQDLPKVSSTLLRAYSLVGGTPPFIEHNLVESLQYWAKLSGGKFPNRIDTVTLNELKRQADDVPEPRRRSFSEKMCVISRSLQFITDRKHGDDWHYAGKGVALGRAGVPVLWYRPRDASVYHVIYADLSVRQVAPADLPTARSERLTPSSVIRDRSEDDLLYALRAWAELNGNRFPADMSYQAAMETSTQRLPDNLTDLSPAESKQAMADMDKRSRLFAGVRFLARNRELSVRWRGDTVRPGRYTDPLVSAAQIQDVASDLRGPDRARCDRKGPPVGCTRPTAYFGDSLDHVRRRCTGSRRAFRPYLQQSRLRYGVSLAPILRWHGPAEQGHGGWPLQVN